jgi:hypothetical protein
MKYILFLSILCFSCTQFSLWEKPEPNQIGYTQTLKTIIQNSDWQRIEDDRVTWRYSYRPGLFCAKPFTQSECETGWNWGVTHPDIITMWDAVEGDSVFAWKVFFFTQDSMILRPIVFGTGEYGEPFTLIPR